MKLKDMLTTSKQFLKTNEAHVLTGITMGGVIFTGIESYKAGLKAYPILKKYREDMALCDDDDISAKMACKLELVKDLTPIIAPSVLTGGLTMTSAFMADRASTKKLVAVSTAYAMSEKTLKATNDKMEELFGKKKAQEVREAVVNDDVVKNPPDGYIFQTKHGDQLCKDMFSGRYFRSSANYIGQCINRLSAECISDYYVSLNDFYDLLGLERTDMGDEFGYNSDDLEQGCLPINFSAQLTEDKTPILCIEYRISPRMDYYREK